MRVIGIGWLGFGLVVMVACGGSAKPAAGTGGAAGAATQLGAASSAGAKPSSAHAEALGAAAADWRTKNHGCPTVAQLYDAYSLDPSLRNDEAGRPLAVECPSDTTTRIVASAGGDRLVLDEETRAPKQRTHGAYSASLVNDHGGSEGTDIVPVTGSGASLPSGAVPCAVEVWHKLGAVTLECYKNALKNNPSLMGPVSIAVETGDAGQPVFVLTGMPEIAACVQGAAQGISLTCGVDGGPALVNERFNYDLAR
jgi:hypothetical protein